MTGLNHAIGIVVAAFVATTLIGNLVGTALAVSSTVGPSQLFRYPNGSVVVAKWVSNTTNTCDNNGKTDYAINLDNTGGSALIDGNPYDNAAGISRAYDGTIESITQLSVVTKFQTGTAEGGSPRLTIGLDTNADGNSDTFLHANLPDSTSCTTTNGFAVNYDATSFLGVTFSGTLADAQTAFAGDNVTFVMVIIDSANGPGQNILVDQFSINNDVLSKPKDMGRKVATS